jgi:hypothetical protein
MMRMTLLLYLLSVCLPVQLRAEELEVKLRYDPFERHPSIGSPRGPQDTPLSEAPPAWAPQLRATLVAGAQSLANVEGVILLLGEKHQGYRLVEVREGEAIFLGNGGRHTLTIK